MGARCALKTLDLSGRRHGSNPGSVHLAGQRHPLRIPGVQRQGWWGNLLRCPGLTAGHGAGR